MDEFLTFIDARRSKIRKHIQRLEGELAELDKSEKLYHMSRRSSAAKQPALDLESSPTTALGGVPSSGPSKISQGLPLTIGSQTIKEAVQMLLASYPDGLTSEQILIQLRAASMPSLERTSLSPQLSRLKRSEILEYRDNRWILAPRKSEAGGGVAPPPASNSPV